MNLMRLPVHREIRVHVTPKDASGEPVALERPATWRCSNSDVLEVLDIEPTQGLIASFVPRREGSCVVEVLDDGRVLTAFDIGVQSTDDAAVVVFDITTEPSRERRA